MVWRFDLYQAIDPGRFAAALEMVVDRHDALSASFGEREGAPYQYRSAFAFSLPEPLDLSTTSDPNADLQDVIDSFVATPFDFAKPCYRALLVRMGPDHWVWLSAQHHIACDAQSGALLFDAVSRAYEVPDAPQDPAPSFFEAAERIDTAYRSMAQDVPAAQVPQPPQSILYGGSDSRMCKSTRVTVPVPGDAIDALIALGHQARFRMFTPDLTRFALLLTAYAAFLSRVSGDQTVMVGLPAHNRLNETDQSTIGLFVEVLPFELDVNDEDTFETLFDKVRAGLGTFLREARPNALARHGTGAPACVLNYIMARFGPFAGKDAKVSWLHSGAHDPHHPLRLHVTQFDGETCDLALDVSANVLAETGADTVAGHLANLIVAVVSNRALPIGAIPLCGAAERREIQVLSRGPAKPEAAKKDVLALIGARVATDPDAMALKSGAETLSYRELWARSADVAADIAARNMPDGPVAIHMKRSVDCILAILGTLRAGRPFVPIAANTPPKRLSAILETAKVVAAFGDEETTPAMSDSGTLCLAVTGTAGDAPDVPASDTAYVVFTSGSTGVPKGVEVSQDGLSRYIQWAARTFGGNAPADYAFFSSLSFDLTITSIFAPLISGGAIHVYAERGETDLAVLDVFADDAVDVVKLTPSHLSLVCEDRRALSRIRTLVLGGENLSTALCRRALETLSPDLRILNEYGPTEAVVGCMVHAFDPDADAEASVPIGGPAEGVEITIRDRALGLLPVGVKGEICIGGRLAKGYLARPDLTQEQFVTDGDGTRIYRSGDIGRLRKDGVFEYFGRADDQLKLGGVRIEPAEIEHALRGVSGVKAVYTGVPPKPASTAPNRHCTRCGLPDTFPGAAFTADGLCQICEQYESYKDRAQAYFRPEPELAAKLQEAASKSRGAYDAVMLLSGGKDSSYAAYRLGAMTSRVLAVTLDNGFIAEGAKANINRVVRDLGWDHRYLTTDKMNAIFVDSLNRHSNVCQGCFKAIYTLAIRTARIEGAPIIVTGLSRGQFFETRLTPELFTTGAPTCAELEGMVTEARRRYHGEDDAIARLLDTGDLSDGTFLDEVEIVDIYRYIDVPVSEIYRFLDAAGAWQRPPDTGRSTNCLINDAGIHVHKIREGYHNYALPYSWDVRMGHKTRDQALAELYDDIDETAVEGILNKIGYETPVLPRPSNFSGPTTFVATDGTATRQAMSDALSEHLPREARPSQIVIVKTLPLTPNGKVDTSLLPWPSANDHPNSASDITPPKTKMELRLATIFRDVIPHATLGRVTDFFDIGIDSLAAIQIAMRANEAGIALPATALFEHRTLKSLAAVAEGLGAASDQADQEIDLDLDQGDLTSIGEALS